MFIIHAIAGFINNKILWSQLKTGRHTCGQAFNVRRRAHFRTTLPRGRAIARQRSGSHKRAKKQSSLLFRPCAPTWIRTKDHLLKRELLYQLSYGRERGRIEKLAFLFAPSERSYACHMGALKVLPYFNKVFLS